MALPGTILAIAGVSSFEPETASVRLLSMTTMGGLNVDLALKLNVLAVLAAFVFVGAILLGAF